MHATTRVRGAGTCNNTCEGNGTQAVQSSRPLHQPLTLMGVKEGEGGHASSAGRSDPRVSARACWGRVRPCQAVSGRGGRELPDGALAPGSDAAFPTLEPVGAAVGRGHREPRSRALPAGLSGFYRRVVISEEEKSWRFGLSFICCIYYLAQVLIFNALVFTSSALLRICGAAKPLPSASH